MHAAIASAGGCPGRPHLERCHACITSARSCLRLARASVSRGTNQPLSALAGHSRYLPYLSSTYRPLSDRAWCHVDAKRMARLELAARRPRQRVGKAALVY